MDNMDFVKELLLAIKFELIRFRVAVVALAVIVIFLVLSFGLNWQKQYRSYSMLFVDDSNIIQPLLAGRAQFSEIDRIDEARKTVYSIKLLKAAATRLNYIDENSTEIEISQILEQLKNNIEIESENRGSNYFSVAYYSSEPAISYETTKVLTELIVRYQADAKREEGENAFGFISRQVAQYKERLENAELALKEYKSINIDADESTVQARLTELDSEIQNLKLGIQDDESNIQTTRAQLSVESEYLSGQSKLYSLRKQKFSLEKQLNDLRLQFQESYPDIVTIKAQVNDIDKEVARISKLHDINPRAFGSFENSESNPEILFDELRRELTEAERELKAKKKRLNSLIDLYSKQEAKMEVVASNQAELADLMRDYTVTKDIYEEMLSRKENAELSVAITREGQGLSYRVVEEPVFPLSPTGLTFIHFLLVAPLLALGAPIGLVVSLVLLDPRIRTVANLESSISGSAEVLCAVPHYHTAFSERILKKDMLVLSLVGGVVLALYIAISVIGLSNQG